MTNDLNELRKYFTIMILLLIFHPIMFFIHFKYLFKNYHMIQNLISIAGLSFSFGATIETLRRMIKKYILLLKLVQLENRKKVLELELLEERDNEND